jgi:hypothetical protein
LRPRCRTEANPATISLLAPAKIAIEPGEPLGREHYFERRVVLQAVWNERRCQHPAAEDGERRVRFVIPVHLSQRAAVISYEFEPILGVLLQNATCTVSQPPQILARRGNWWDRYGNSDDGRTLKNTKHDTILFKCIAP